MGYRTRNRRKKNESAVNEALAMEDANRENLNGTIHTLAIVH